MLVHIGTNMKLTTIDAALKTVHTPASINSNDRANGKQQHGSYRTLPSNSDSNLRFVSNS